MVALAAAALTDLLWAFTPLTSVWAAHEATDRGGGTPGAVLIISYGGVGTALLLAHLAAWVLLAVWLHRAAANAQALGWSRWPAALAAGAWFIPLANWLLPPFIVAAMARAGRLRRGALVVWSWWPTWLAGVAGLVAGTELTWPAELSALLSQVSDGATVDVDRADQLLGYQIAGRLPGAVVLLAAAVLGIVAVHLVTTAQYDRFDEVRAAGRVGSTAPTPPVPEAAPPVPEPEPASLELSGTVALPVRIDVTGVPDAHTDHAPTA
jgi:hypothetical protein